MRGIRLIELPNMFSRIIKIESIMHYALRAKLADGRQAQWIDGSVLNLARKRAWIGGK